MVRADVYRDGQTVNAMAGSTLASGTSSGQINQHQPLEKSAASFHRASASSANQMSRGSSASNTSTTNPNTSSSRGRKGGGLLACPGIGTAVNNLKISWGYGWIEDPNTIFTDENLQVPSGLDLVPLIARTAGATSSVFDAIKSQSNYKAILGPNEPDVNEKDPQATAKVWPQFVATGLRVGSPAPAHTTLESGDWFVEFMSAIAAAGSHVNFIALHSYGEQLDNVAGSVADVKSYIEAVYARYQLPIWLTETAMATWEGSNCWANGCYPDEATQAEFASALVQMLEGLDEGVLERYSYFEVGGEAPSNLCDNNSGALTSAGQAYAAA